MIITTVTLPIWFLIRFNYNAIKGTVTRDVWLKAVSIGR